MSPPLAEHILPSGQRLALHRGDLTQETTDAIVNAANSHLAHGGGVAGAIVRRGGSEIQHESDRLVASQGPVPVGGAVWTGPGSLKVKGIIHAVGPRWGEGAEPAKLRRAAMSALTLAEEKACRSVALPAISSGIFGFPKPQCAEILVQAALDFFADRESSSLREIRFTIIDDETIGIFRAEFARRFGIE